MACSACPARPVSWRLLTGIRGAGRPPPPAIRETSVAGLSVLTCGALPSNAANLLSGTRMRVLLQELREQFDIIVLDTPPVLATADAGIVASLTDGVLLVVRAGATDRNAAQRACQQLANVGARVIGTVLNDPGGQVAKEGDYYYPYDYAAEEQWPVPPALTQADLPRTIASGPADSAAVAAPVDAGRLETAAGLPEQAAALGLDSRRQASDQHVVFHRSPRTARGRPRGARSG